jgi:A/G-specific adenine glycosylase
MKSHPQNTIISKAKKSDFQSMIFSWWRKNRRDLPWRHTRDPYAIVVSELMLQQTQVARVLPKYREFLGQFPTVFDLAKASPADVLIAWKGMGYNRRALYLKKMAEIIVQQYGGVFPQQEKELMALPGLGTYTVRAVMVFAFGKDVAMVDTNIRQIITHYFFDDILQPDKDIQALADQLLPQGKSWEWHQALMDYGALEMKKMERPKKVSRISIPFFESNRFYRGRVVDRLRLGGMKEKHLFVEFEQLYSKKEQFMEQILEGLERDGLVVREKGVLYLPK